MLVPSFTVVFFSFYVLFTCTNLVQSQQNVQEEAICSKFLTSRDSSPLLPNLQRNLKYDEDAEFSCELVLQDKFLPPQIRLTIHEGLYYLQERHLEQGISKELEAARHSAVLAEMLPNAYRFRHYAGSWQLSPKVNRPDIAYTHLHHCLYGKAAKDIDKAIDNHLRYQTRLLYIQALGQLGQLERVKEELMLLLKAFPFDFRAQFLLEESMSAEEKTAQRRDSVDDEDTSQTTVYPKIIEQLIEEIVATDPERFSQYQGVLSKANRATSSPSWEIYKFTSLPSKEEFQTYIERREPFIISFGDIASLDEAMKWKVSQWINNLSYWKKRVDPEESAQMEGIPKSLLAGCTLDPDNNEDSLAPQCGQFGLNLQVRRRFMNVHDMLSKQFSDQNYSYYLNIQPGYSGDGLYRSPLHFMKDDIPVHDNEFFADIMKNMTNVQLWIGKTLTDNQLTMSRLHRDATDNLYVLLQGKKEFSLWSPSDSFHLHTISPTIGVNVDGLSYQFDVNTFKSFIYHRLNERNTTLEQIFSQSHTNSDYYHLLNAIVANEAIYNTEDNHFSKLSTHHTHTSVEECVDNDGEQQQCTVGKSLPSPAAVIQMEPGDILYIPTGWFHQVKSFGGAHMALNYWWKPLNWQHAKEFEFNLTTEVFNALWDKLKGTNLVEV